MQRFFPVCALLILIACVGSHAQTVIVDPTNSAPDNVTTFNSLMMALHSFQVTGKVAAATDSAGVGVHYGDPAPDVVQIVSTSPLDEVVRIDERLVSSERCVLANPLTVRGPGGGAMAPSPSANAVVRVRDDGANDDGFEIRTDVDITFENITFVPSPTAPFGDDLVTIDRLTQGGPNYIVFRSCVFTTLDSSPAQLPVVQTKADSLEDRRSIIGTPAGAVDDLLVIRTDSGEATVVQLWDCVLSHTTQDSSSGGHDGIVELSAARSVPGDQRIELHSTVVSYCQRYGVVLFGAGADSAPTRWQFAIEGNDVASGPTGGLGGPSIFFFNQRGVQSSLSAKGCFTASNLICANTDRQLSLNRDTITTLSDVMLVGSVPFAIEFEVGSPNVTWERLSWMSAGSPPLLGGNNGASAQLTLRDCVMAGAGGPCLGTFGVGDLNCRVEYSAAVLAGPYASTTLGGTLNTVFANVINDDPQFASTNVLFPSCLDVTNCAYEGKAFMGGALRGAADFAATCSYVAGWKFY